jgi:hypothetical protein
MLYNTWNGFIKSTNDLASVFFTSNVVPMIGQ